MIRLALCWLALLAGVVSADEAACCRVFAGNGVGSGFAVAHSDIGDLVLTNHHVIGQHRTQIFCEFADGRYTATLVKIISPRDRGDVVLLRCRSRRGRTIMRISTRRIRAGERLRWLGFAGGRRQLSRGSGVVLPTRYTSGTIEIRGRASIAGESGSPVVDAGGVAVGIVWGGGQGFPNAAAATPFSAVQLTQCIGSVCTPTYRVEVEEQKPDEPDCPPCEPYKLTDEDVEAILGKLPPIQVVFHTEKTWKSSYNDQTLRIADGKPTLHLPPITLEMWLEKTKGGPKEKIDVISAPLHAPLQLLNGIE